MTLHELSAAEAKHEAERAVRRASPWLDRLGRFGFVAKGVVYTLVGVLAAEAAIGAGGKATDPHGALRYIVQAPMGHLLLGLIAAGLVGYALWRFVQAAFDTDHHGSGARGVVRRVGFAFVGAVYTGLAITAVRLATGAGTGQSGDAAARDWTAWLLARPLGQWLVALAGAVVIGIGIGQVLKASGAKFRRNLNLQAMSRAMGEWITGVGRLGYTARGVVFALIGGFLIVAAIRARPEEARGLGGALDTLAHQPAGPWLLGIVALGFVAYGLFMFVEARYRHVIAG